MEGQGGIACNGSTNQEMTVLLHTLALAGVSLVESFETLIGQGFRPARVLLPMLRSLPAERVYNSWPRIDLVGELLSASLISLVEAAEALNGVGIHPMSLLGIGWYWDEPVGPSIMEVDRDRTLKIPTDLTGQAHCDLTGGIVLSSFQEMKMLPSGVKTGNLTLERLPRLRAIEEGVEVSGFFNIKSCGALKSLPRSIEDVSRLSVTSCDCFEGLQLHHVTGDLHIEECEGFFDLSGPLEVGGSLSLAHLPRLEGLGTQIKVGQDLHLTALADRFRLPEDLQVGGRIIVRPPRGSIGMPKRLYEKVLFSRFRPVDS